jgi:succinyl-diaminopimelate desuccinylase
VSGVERLSAEALASLTYELVAVASPTGGEAALADLVEARCRALPWTSVERLGNAVVARVGPLAAPAVALVGHLDTVPPWEGHEPSLEGLRVVGRGAADMKGGDAAILAALEACAHAQQPVVALFYDREEGPNVENGIHAALASTTLLGRPPFAFVGEPTGCDVHAGCVGVLNADLVFRGRTAHSARPWEGENAILRAAPFLARAAQHVQRPVEVEGLVFHDTLAVTMASAGLARNVVPDRLTLALNVRFAPSRDAASARAEIERLVAGEGELRWLDESPPAAPALDEPVLRDFLAATGAAVLPKQAWTDVATLRAHGVPAVNYGPGEASQAHQPQEWVDGDAVATVARNLAAFLIGDRGRLPR